MALSNSSIHSWLDYNLENPLPVLRPCAIRTSKSTAQVPSVTTADCSLVCTNNTSNGWIWIMWANCVIRAVFSTIRQRFRRLWYRLTGLRIVSPAIMIRRLETVFFYSSWSVCFAYQTYLYRLYFNRSLISMTWSFRQIVAILIFAPTLVELIYIELQSWRRTVVEFRLPKTYQIPNDDTLRALNIHAILDHEQSSREKTAIVNASHDHPSNGRQINLETLAAGERRMPGTHMRAHSL